MSADIRQWAVKGAALRLAELDAERERILQTFPELRQDATPLHTGPAALHAKLAARVNGKRPHWTQTPEGAKRWARIQRKGHRAMRQKGASRG